MTSDLIYWEPQESGFCGKHCLNNLLQSSLFTEFDLAEIGQQLDAQERDLMAQSFGGVNSTEFVRWLAENEHQNVDNAGNFSIQVLNQACKIFGLEAVNLHSERAKAAQADPVNQASSFLLHFRDHWFSMRRLHGQWYDLNSLKDYGPTHISDTYLQLFIHQLQNEGWTVFTLLGEFPSRHQSTMDLNAFSQAGGARWFSHQDCLANAKKPPKKQQDEELARVLQDSAGASSSSSSYSADLERAMKASLNDYENNSSSSSSQVADKPQPFDFSANRGHSMIAMSDNSPSNSEEDELQRAIALCMKQDDTPSPNNLDVPDEPETSSETVSVRIKMPDKSTLSRRFLASHTLRQLHDFVESNLSASTFSLLTTFPSKTLVKDDEPIQSLGLGRQISLVCRSA